MRIAIAGLKGHQGVVVEGIARVPGAQIVAASDDEPGKAEALAGLSCAVPDLRTYQDWRQMLDEVEIDILVEAGVDSERADVICAALDRRLHVLAEKPLAWNLEGLKRVRDALEGSRACLSMLLTMRYDPLYRAVRRAVQSGRVGRVCLASMQKSYRLGQRPAWQRDRRTFSGIIPFIGIHALDLIVWTTGLKPVSGFAYQGNTGHPEIGHMEDNAVVALELEGGAHGDLRLDYCRPALAPTHGDDRLRVAGSEGVVEAFGAEGRVTLLTNDEEPQELAPQTAPDLFVEFVEAANSGGEAPIAAGECLAVTEWTLRLRECAKSGEVARF